MPYDPTLPASHSPIVSAELRNQFAGLKTLIDGKTTSAQVTDAINQQSSANSNGVFALGMNVSDPPTQGEVQEIADKIDELLAALKRS
jgi:hypothetical protein